MSIFDASYDKYLRACLSCGALPLRGRSQPFCEFCEKFFLKNAGLIRRHEQNWSAYSLWLWQSDDSVVGEVIKRLKGGGPDTIYDYFAKMLLQQWFMANGRITRPVTVVPAPARSVGERDHAYCLARAIAVILEANFSTPLFRADTIEQKSKNREDRQQQQFVCVPDFVCDGRLILFVDDVIVTGSTIAAAHCALGKPTDFMSWCLADRIRLC